MGKKNPSELEFRLLSLLAKERTGRELAKMLEKTGGKEIAYGTLYVALGRMREAGWIVARPDPNGDGRTRLFKIRGEGSAVLSARQAEHAALAKLPRGVVP